MPKTVEEFSQQLTNAGLMSAGEVATFASELATPPADAESFAKQLIRAGKLTKYQAASIYQGKGKTLVFGDYVVLDKIGAGGMGVVLKAQHRRMKRIVAVKVLPAKAMDSEAAVLRFYREVEAAAKLIHPNIVTAFDAGEHRGMHYLVMEFVDGQDLSDILSESGPLPIEHAVECTIQAAKGLEYAHDHGIVHRDIKPANLLLTKDGTIKILDMGLARLTGEIGQHDQTQDGQLTQSGQIMGTVDYMAPEQAMDTRTADQRADVYALGCTLFRLLTGQSVYEGDTVMKRLMAHQQSEIPSLCDKRADVPAALEQVFQRMVAKEPDDRQQSMNELVEKLQAAMSPDRPPEKRVSNEPSSDSALTEFFAHLNEEKQQVATTPKAQQQTAVAEETVDYKGGIEETGDRQPQVGEVGPIDPVSTPEVERHTTVLAKKEIAERSNQRKLIWIAAIGGPLCVAGLLCIAMFLVDQGSDAPMQTTQPTGDVVTHADTLNYALQFDGESSRVEIDTFAYDGNGPLTIEAFVTPSRFDGWSSIVSNKFDGGFDLAIGHTNNQHLLILAHIQEWLEDQNRTVSRKSASPSAATIDETFHVAGVINGNYLDIFINGERQNSVQLDGDYVPNTDPSRLLLTIGASPSATNGGRDFFAGTIDEVRISRIARYDHFGFVAPQPHERFEVDDDTLALYHFDEGPGSKVARDATGKHDGTIRNCKYVPVDDGSENSFAFDQAGPPNAMQFNGTSSYVEVDSLSLDGTKPFTLEAWTTPESNRVGALISQSSSSGGVMLRQNYEGNWELLFRDNEGWKSCAPGLLTGSRQHVAFVFDGGDVRLFVGGEQVEHMPAVSGQIPIPADTKLRIGAGIQDNKLGLFFEGTIDEVRISSVARYTEDFTLLRPHERFEVDDDTLALYHFDEGPGSKIARDATGRHDGTIHNCKSVRVDWPETPPLANAPFDAATAKTHQQAWAEYLGLPMEREVDLPGGATLTMILIPPGEFLMGSDKEEQEKFLEEANAANHEWAIERIPSEGPRHRVRITRPFYLGKYEVTQAQWQAVTGSNPSEFKDNPTHPVEMASWNDVQGFLTRVNEAAPQQGMSFDLPTEAQWEYASRAGSTTFWHFGDRAAALQEYGWFNANSSNKTHPVGRLQPNAFGIYDMHGNLWEWCADWYAADYYAKTPVDDPSGSSAGLHRVVRGGYWLDHAMSCRSAYRDGSSPDYRSNRIGFRLAATIEGTNAIASDASHANYGLRFDGQDDWIDIPSLQYDGSHPITLEAWVRLDRLDYGCVVAGFGPRPVALGHGRKHWGINRIVDGDQARWISADDPTPMAGESMHVAGIVDGDQLALFINGKQQERSPTAETMPRRIGEGGFVIGGSPPTDPGWQWYTSSSFYGLIDEVRISRVARYTDDFTPPQPHKRFEVDDDTLALYHFDEGPGSKIARDATGRHDGTINNCKFVSVDSPQTPPLAIAPLDAVAELMDVRAIWTQAPHNAYTDLIRVDDQWFCVLREGATATSIDGKLRVITSADGAAWKSAAQLQSPAADLRDPKIARMPDGRMMLSAVKRVEPTAAQDQTLAWYSDDGHTWSEPIQIGDTGRRLWRVTWHDENAYSMAYSYRPFALSLYRSQDGRRFEVVEPELNISGDPSEVSLMFLPNDQALALVRRMANPKTAALGLCMPPYTDWSWQDLGTQIAGPVMLRLDDGRIVTAVRLFNPTRTSVCWLDPVAGSLTEALKLPSGGDTAFAGMVQHDGLLWVSYYSSHEGKANVYLAKVRLPTTSSTSQSWTDLLKNGDLEAWNAANDPDAWTIEDGILKGTHGQGLLITKETYADFELKLDFRLPSRGNGGIFLRVDGLRTSNGGQCLEVQLVDDAGQTEKTGSIKDLLPKQPTPDIQPNQWYTAFVRCVGSQLTVTINGQQTVDVDLADLANQLKPRSGFNSNSGTIGLQRWRSSVEYRDIRIREL